MSMSDEVVKLKKEQRRESILQTSLVVLSEKGIEGTTMREIARLEKISETLLYRFFKNKYEILIAIFQSYVLKTIEKLNEFRETIKGMIPDPEQTLPIIVKLAKKKLTENEPLISFIQKEGPHLPEHFQHIRTMAKVDIQFRKQIVEKIQELRIDQAFNDYFERCKNAGNLREDVDINVLTNLFLRLLISPMRVNFFTGEGNMPVLSEQQREQLIMQQIDIILKGIVPQKRRMVK